MWELIPKHPNACWVKQESTPHESFMETTSLTPRATNNQWSSLLGNNLILSTGKSDFREPTVLQNTLDIYIINHLCAQSTGYRLSQPLIIRVLFMTQVITHSFYFVESKSVMEPQNTLPICEIFFKKDHKEVTFHYQGAQMLKIQQIYWFVVWFFLFVFCEPKCFNLLWAKNK